MTGQREERKAVVRCVRAWANGEEGAKEVNNGNNTTRAKNTRGRRVLAFTRQQLTRGCGAETDG